MKQQSIKQQTEHLDDRFADLHNRYRSRLLNSITGIVKDRAAAEDITAAAFAKAFEYRKDFRGEASVYTWLYRIAVNEAYSSQSRNRSVSLDSLTGVPEALIECDRTADSAEQSECRLSLDRALAKIPPVYRQVLLDHIAFRHPVKRIARRDDIPVGTVLSRIFTAKRLLRAAWEA